MTLVEFVQAVSVAVQLGVAIYALWLNQFFGTHRAGWSLCGAFVLMALLYATRMWDIEGLTFSFAPGLGAELIYLFISLLLLMGMSHVHAVFKERKKAEDALLKSQQTLEERVRERTLALVQANEDLRNEIGERKLMEAQLLRAQKIEAMGDLAAGAAHEFNEVLLVIECYAQLLAGRLSDDREAVQQLSQLLGAAQKASGLTRQLLAFSSRQQMKPRVLQIHHLLLNQVNRIQHLVGEGVTVTVETCERPPLAYVDPDLLEQALNCLASNAREAMPKGGELTLGASVVSVDQTYCELHGQGRPGEFVCLSVRDTGVGMAPETLARVFEPFFTTKEQGKGAGLGMATVQGIVRQHKGWVEVESELKKGTAVKIYVPGAAQALEGAKKQAPARGGGTRGDETILVADGDESNRRTMHGILHEYGYKVLEASNPLEALAIFEGEVESVDLLMLGTAAGKESARQLAGQFRMMRPELAVILISAAIGEVVGNALEETDEYQYLQKPFNKEHVAKIVRDRLDRRSASRGNWETTRMTAPHAKTPAAGAAPDEEPMLPEGWGVGEKSGSVPSSASNSAQPNVSDFSVTNRFVRRTGPPS